MPDAEDAYRYCSRRFSMEVKPLPSMDEFHHTFTHFKLRIRPLPLQVVSLSSKAALERDAEVKWFTRDDALNAAIPAPVRKLIAKIDNSRTPPSDTVHLERVE
jgi:A/G-specific adenine glycosylase